MQFEWHRAGKLDVRGVACSTGKAIYGDHASAARSVEQMVAAGKGGTLAAYVCRECHHWHIGNTAKKERS